MTLNGHSSFTPLPVELAGRSRDGLSDRVGRVLLVDDPQAGTVVVRWRFPVPGATWIWRCGGCGTRSIAADCAHKYAAGLHLARTALGLTPVAVESTATHTQDVEAASPA